MKIIQLNQTRILSVLAIILGIAGGASFAGADPDAYQAALKACGQNAPVDWKTLDPAAKETLHACMRKNGVAVHPHHKKFFKAVQACAAQKGTELPKFVPGEARPQLTDAQKAVVKACSQEVASNFKAQQ